MSVWEQHDLTSSNWDQDAIKDSEISSSEMIWKSYKPTMKGQYLPSDEVVRAKTHKHYLFEEQEHFLEYSNVSRPTYGNCLGCWKSGPLSKICNECEGKHCAYQEFYYVNKYTNGDIYLDAESILQVMLKGHEVARADRNVNKIKAYDKFEITIELFLNKYDPKGTKQYDELFEVVQEFFWGRWNYALRKHSSHLV